jgi:transcriptional regulator with XRE-family HTH domain
MDAKEVRGYTPLEIDAKVQQYRATLQRRAQQKIPQLTAQAEALRQLKARGLPYRTLERVCGVNKSLISRWLHGTRVMTAVSLQQVQQFLREKDSPA